MDKIGRREMIKKMAAACQGLAVASALGWTGRSPSQGTQTGERSGRPRAFKRSDVVFAFVFTPQEYKMWHGNVLFGWCGAPVNKEEIPKYLDRQKKSLEVGVREGAGISGFADDIHWFKQRDPNWQDALWRNFEGKLLTYPWVRPPDPFPPEKGEICTNHPRFLEKKRAETELAMAVSPYAFHIDDPLGTATELSVGGCFCKYCVAGFRDYLTKNVPLARLREAGVTDPDHFDYGEFLRAKGGRAFSYEFENFQLRSSVEHVRKIFDFAREKRAKRIPVGANAPVVGAHIVFAPYLDYIAAEIGTDAKEMKFGAKPLLNYKMGDALGIAIAATGIYKDWVMLTGHDIPDLVRGWVAEAYAMGHNFIVPHKEWGFVQPPGKGPQSTAYPAKPELIGPLYGFVRQNPELFDGYCAVARVGLLYDYKANRVRGSGQQMPQTPEQQSPPIHQICLELANANIPFGIVVSGSEPLDWEMTTLDLERYEFLVLNEPTMLEGKQKEILDNWSAKGRVVKWNGINSVLSRAQKLVAADPSDGKIWVLPRVRPGDRKAPLVCHVLNRVFDAKAERMDPQRNVKVSLHRAIFENRKREKCTIYVERQRARDLPVSINGDMVEVTLPELELWGVLRFA